MTTEKSALLSTRHFTPVLALLSALALLGLLLMIWQFIERAVADEEDAMLYALSLRAQSLGWAVEGAARLHKANLSELLVEMGQQPGVVYLALVNEDGRIVLDSNPAVAGQPLYTAQELKSLAPANIVQGRFSPDDENIFETWKIFNPGRVRGHHLRQPLVLFIALDATNFQKVLNTYRGRLILEAALLLLLMICASGLAYFAFNYHLSRRRLEDTRALADQIIKSYPSPLLVTDLEGNIRFANAEARDFFSMGSGAKSLNSLPGLNWTAIMAEIRQDKTAFEQELICRLDNGRACPISFSDAIVRDNCDAPLGWLFVLRDLTQIKNLQKQLTESRRLAALGHMAAGIAHEIRNPLSSIRGYAGYLRQRLTGNAWAAATASLLEEEAIRLDRALSDLLLLSKKPRLQCEPTPLGELLRKLQLLLEPDARAKNIRLRLELPESDISLQLDKDRMLQALLNIALNAVEATEAGGEIVIGFRRDQLDPGLWLISVRDSGRGIDAGDLEQIFTPYFTTRAEGTGLGLTVTRQIIEAHDGQIDVSSSPGQGTTFSIYLREDAKCQSAR